ncbi:MAG: hypothetical protein H0Z33_06780 [Bacillaceae bacterium]|nr:hypothetical protein [Bacillaceae bacterium]
MNTRLQEVKKNQREQRRLQSILKQTEQELQDQREKAEQARRQLEKEEEDVERLEGMSLVNLFSTMLGKKEERIRTEKQEAVRARLQYEEAQQTLKDMEQEVADLRRKISALGDVDTAYKAILKEKEQFIKREKPGLGEKLYQLAEKKAEHQALLKEVEEARQAGEDVAGALDRVLESLNKAGGWGAFDMLGGGLISTAVKHRHIDDARQHVHIAQKHMRRFKKELKDIDTDLNLKLRVEGLLTFADFFFDGLIVDWVVQGRIHETSDRAEKNRQEVKDLIRQLEHQKHQLKTEISRLSQETIRLIERAGNQG